ncbi:GNAT family N-acetyltransferase [Micromonospora chersina]|uniref:GNAT family N-acetyltransferase n=1 Tax=Micromonospora chersina TaxID=47854 RepID=UPI0037225CC0
MDVAVQLVTEVTSEIVAAFCRVEPELSSRPGPVAPAELHAMASCEVYRLLKGRVAGEIRGTLVLVVLPPSPPVRVRARIEDVVVARSEQGIAVADALVRRAVDLAWEAGASSVKLTSRRSLVEANSLYERLGFEHLGSDIYQLTIKPQPHRLGWSAG